MEKTLNIGIIGGCMTCQTDLKLSQLFYRSFSQTLLEKESVKCFVSLKYYNEYYRIPGRIQEIIAKLKPGVMIIQVRPAPMIMRCEFLIQNYRGGYILNPLIFKPVELGKLEAILGTKEPVFAKLQSLSFWKRLLIGAVLSKNMQLGRIFGLHQRALDSVREIMEQSIGQCKKENIPLLIIGPLNASYPQNNIVLGKLNKTLKIVSEQSGTGYIDIYSILEKERKRFFTRDEHHLNAEGHGLVSDMLYEEFKKIGERIEYTEKS
jgi:hypothetical protein